MADSKPNQGYQCEFIDSVPNNLQCQKCKLVARRLVYTSCCGESYCHDCIAESSQENNVCLACEEKGISLLVFQKYVRQIESLKVYCSMKKRGCEWKGTLGQLEDHLDPNNDGCQFINIKCPYNCSQLIPKNELEDHLEKVCAKREHTCQHCGFKATYEEVVNIHLPECKYVALQCPNRCGVTCEREDLEHHLKMCRLQEVTCQFSNMGCEKRFLRENEEEHFHQNNLSHLSMTAAQLATVNQELQEKIDNQQEEVQVLEKKLEGQDRKILDQEAKLKELQQTTDQKIWDLKEKLQDLKRKAQDQKRKILEQEKKLQHQEKEMVERIQYLEQTIRNQGKKLLDQEEEMGQKMDYMEQRILEQHKKLRIQEDDARKGDQQLQDLQRTLGMRILLLEQHNTFSRRFTVENFSKRKELIDIPAMYTHVPGYKFQIYVFPSGHGSCRDDAMTALLSSLQGEYDDKLTWPVVVRFTLELENQKKKSNNVSAEVTVELKRPSKSQSVVASFNRITVNGENAFLKLRDANDFLYNDSMDFKLAVRLM